MRSKTVQTPGLVYGVVRRKRTGCALRDARCDARCRLVMMVKEIWSGGFWIMDDGWPKLNTSDGGRSCRVESSTSDDASNWNRKTQTQKSPGFNQGRPNGTKNNKTMGWSGLGGALVADWTCGRPRNERLDFGPLPLQLALRTCYALRRATRSTPLLLHYLLLRRISSSYTAVVHG